MQLITKKPRYFVGVRGSQRTLFRDRRIPQYNELYNKFPDKKPFVDLYNHTVDATFGDMFDHVLGPFQSKADALSVAWNSPGQPPIQNIIIWPKFY